MKKEEEVSMSERIQEFDDRIEKLFKDNESLQDLEKTMYEPKEKITVSGEFMNTLIGILSSKDTMRQNLNLAFAGMYRQLELNTLSDSALTELALTEHVKNLKKKKFK